LAWARCEAFLRTAQSAYISRLPNEERPSIDEHPTNPGLLTKAFRERLRSALRIPALEALFPEPWTPAARRMLPSHSPQLTSTAIWGPILVWCALELLSESINAREPERVALDLFDRLRLREPFGHAFAALGIEGDDSWRVAARIKVVLLTGAGIGKEETATTTEPVETEPVKATQNSKDPEQKSEPKQPSTAPEFERVALAPALWHDPDVGWLTGLNEAEGHYYINREQYEELLWWLLMPSLLSLAGQANPDPRAFAQLSKTVTEALETAEASGFRMDELFKSASEIEIFTDESVDEPGDEDAGILEQVSEPQLNKLHIDGGDDENLVKDDSED
jgi:hypothetical protein